MITLRINSACETMDPIGNDMVWDSEFVRWSSAFHHVFVFTVKKTCLVHLYHRVYHVDRNFLVQKYIFLAC